MTNVRVRNRSYKRDIIDHATDISLYPFLKHGSENCVCMCVY